MAEGNLRLILDDLKTSWYFRIWVLLWIVCAVISFAALIVLSQSSNQNQLKPGWRIFIQEERILSFPDFYFSLLPFENTTLSMNNMQCYYGNRTPHQAVTLNSCNGTMMTDCFVAQTSSFTSTITQGSQPTFPFWSGSAVMCDVQLNVQNVTGDDTVITVGVYNNQRIYPQYIQPNTVAEIRIEEEVFTPKSGGSMTHYRLETEYHSNVNNYATFTVFFRFRHHRVIHFEETNLFNGWMGVGDIGGFVFFLYLLHTIAMALIGICVPNTSRFLGGSTSEGYVKV